MKSYNSMLIDTDVYLALKELQKAMGFTSLSTTIKFLLELHAKVMSS